MSMKLTIDIGYGAWCSRTGVERTDEGFAAFEAGYKDAAELAAIAQYGGRDRDDTGQHIIEILGITPTQAAKWVKAATGK